MPVEDIVAHATQEPMPTLDLDAMRRKAADFNRARIAAREDYQRHASEEADAERDYRKHLAVRFTNLRTEGKGAGEAELLAKGEDDVAELEHKRSLAKSKAKASLLRIEQIERAQTTLRDVYAASSRIDGVAA